MGRALVIPFVADRTRPRTCRFGLWLSHKGGLSGGVKTMPGMSQNFLSVDRDQVLLMPPSLAEWLPSDHVAWFVLEAVKEMDLRLFLAAYRADGHGRAAHDPEMMWWRFFCTRTRAGSARRVGSSGRVWRMWVIG